MFSFISAFTTRMLVMRYSILCTANPHLNQLFALFRTPFYHSSLYRYWLLLNSFRWWHSMSLLMYSYSFSVTQMNPQTYIIYTISRKFKYLKKTIYKKCDEINLFDHSCRGKRTVFHQSLDIEERFAFFVNVILTAFMLYQSNGIFPSFVSCVDLSILYWEQVAVLFLVDEVIHVLRFYLGCYHS